MDGRPSFGRLAPELDEHLKASCVHERDLGRINDEGSVSPLFLEAAPQFLDVGEIDLSHQANVARGFRVDHSNQIHRASSPRGDWRGQPWWLRDVSKGRMCGVNGRIYSDTSALMPRR